MSSASHRRNVLTIPPGVAFLPAFTKALLAGKIVAGFPEDSDPFALSAARIFVPTRRAARALTAEIARQLGRTSVILPQIVPLGAMDDSETASLFSGNESVLSRPPVISEAERRLVLAGLILVWSQKLRNAIHSVDSGRMTTNLDEPFLVTSSPAQAFHMAGDLGALIDEMTIEGIDPSRLQSLAPERFDKYWGITLEFLKIAFDLWPNHLEEKGLEDRAHRQAALVEDEIRRLRDGSLKGPQIVIGSTGTNIATAKLIAAIASLPQGAVVLPGLDTFMDEVSWKAISTGASKPAEPARGHPQAALQRLLEIIGISRADVRQIGTPAPDISSRMEFIREALRPAETTDQWLEWRKAHSGTYMPEALAGITLIEADDERQEALAIAIALRQTLTWPDKTAAFITPDRDLARRVKAELQRWHIEIDDSGGDPLQGQPAGILASLVLQCAEPNANAAATLALLDHAQVRLGYSKAEYTRLRTMAEIAVLRGNTWNMDVYAQSLEMARTLADDPHAHPLKRDLTHNDWSALEVFFKRQHDACLPLRQISGEAPLASWLEAHWNALERLQELPEGEPAPQSEDSLALQTLLDSFLSVAPPDFQLSLSSYTSLFASIAQETIVRGPRRTHPRIKILGLLEARLMNADVIVLGGLDETIWPPAARTDAFLNRPMRAELGMTSPERRIGQTAHDFVEASGAQTLILTRAHKRGGAPAVPSRFLQRIAALAGDHHWKVCKARGNTLLRFANLLDDAGHPSRPVTRPEPRPPLSLRPQGLSITQIETWRRDPYSIYAQHILKLMPLDGIDADNAAAEFGTSLHSVLADFHTRYPAGQLPAEANNILLAIAEEHFAMRLLDPDFQTFKWPGALAFLNNFVAWENERRPRLARMIVEQSGKLTIPLADGSNFLLRGRADRLELAADGSVVIIDYKSGVIPTNAVINAGFSPQLTLEAAMIERGAFNSLPGSTKVSDAQYVPIGKDDEIKSRHVGNDGKPFEQLVAEHYSGLLQLANQFRDPVTPYLARPFPQFENKYGDYDHLARVKEWASSSGGEEG